MSERDYEAELLLLRKEMNDIISKETIESISSIVDTSYCFDEYPNIEFVSINVGLEGNKTNAIKK